MITFNNKLKDFFHIKRLSISILIVLISIIIPSFNYFESKLIFGYPFRFLTIYDSINNMKPNQSLIQFIKIDLGIFIINILIVNTLIYFAQILIKRIKYK